MYRNNSVSKAWSIWKPNLSYGSRILVEKTLASPTLTIQWLPDVSRNEENDGSVHRLVLGTFTRDEQNLLLIASVEILDNKSGFKKLPSKPEGGAVPTPAVFAPIGVLKTDISIKHPGEVNRARYMPQTPHLIATQSNMSDVLIFNYKNHGAQLQQSEKSQPELRLKGHTDECFGLAWNPNLSGHLLSCSHDQTICLWDINSTTNDQRVVSAKNTFKGHIGAVQDVAWHRFHESMFGSVGSDQRLMIWDTRNSDTSRPICIVNAHLDVVNDLSFNPHSEFMLATCSSDKTVNVWDLRYLQVRLHSLVWNDEQFLGVRWSPFNEKILCSFGSGHAVHVWDLSKIGQPQTTEEAKLGAPELLFMHAGHVGPISDLSWNMNSPWVVSSSFTDNRVRIWQVGERT